MTDYPESESSNEGSASLLSDDDDDDGIESERPTIHQRMSIVTDPVISLHEFNTPKFANPSIEDSEDHFDFDDPLLDDSEQEPIVCKSFLSIFAL